MTNQGKGRAAVPWDPWAVAHETHHLLGSSKDAHAGPGPCIENNTTKQALAALMYQYLLSLTDKGTLLLQQQQLQWKPHH